MMLRNSIEQLIHRQNLNYDMCVAAFDEALSVNQNFSQLAAFLVLLRAKVETTEEFSAIASVMKNKMIAVATPHRVLDIVGTGGDGANTINISTGSAILAASCGVKIAKHGNHAVSSLTGSADVLEALGVVIDLSPEKISQCIDQVGIGFCFAPNFHPVMKVLRTFRKQLNVPTIFNFLGPLLNPANPKNILFGIFDESRMHLVAHSLQRMGMTKSLVVHGHGLDELSTMGPCKVLEVTDTDIQEFMLDPAALGLSLCNLSALQGGHAKMNAEILLSAFSGKKTPISDTLILNAAAALYLYGKYLSLADAIPHARDNLYSGKSLSLLNHWREFSHDQST